MIPIAQTAPIRPPSSVSELGLWLVVVVCLPTIVYLFRLQNKQILSISRRVQEQHEECQREREKQHDLRAAEIQRHSDLRQEMSDKNSENTLSIARELIKITHQANTSSSQIADWLQRSDQFFRAFREEVVNLIRETRSGHAPK